MFSAVKINVEKLYEYAEQVKLLKDQVEKQLLINLFGQQIRSFK